MNFFFFCHLHDRSSSTIVWRRAQGTTIQENVFSKMKNGISPRNPLHFVKSRFLFRCFRASTANKIRQCCRQLHLKQVHHYCHFVALVSVYFICRRFCEKILFVQASFIYQKTIANNYITICRYQPHCRRLL